MQCNDILLGDALAVMQTLPDASVHCIVTSPPYYWARDYGITGQYGHEETPAAYVAHLAAVFAEARRVLHPTGTLWLNLGDTYYSGKGQPHGEDTRSHARTISRHTLRAVDRGGWDIPRKSLIGIPWMVAFALQQQGWCLRSEIIWHRENCQPEASANDRPHRKHEKIFLFTQSRHYTFNRQPLDGIEDVWRIPVAPGDGMHSAMFPVALATRCIAVGSHADDIVLDPFMGLGTTGCAATYLKRQWVGIELNPTYREKALKRIERFALLHPLFATDA